MVNLYHCSVSREMSVSRETSSLKNKLTATFKQQYLLVLLLLTVIFSFPLAAEPVGSLNTMPGRLVSVGTHQLHIYCTGEGRPTVIIDSGLGGFSLEWKKVQSSMAEEVQVCTYDRAGYGWSQAGPEPRTTRQIVNELHDLLLNAEVPGLYILVGHSFGGYNIRYYASLYPESVAGLVLVDASHPDQFDRLPQPEIRKVNIPAKSSTVRLSMPVIPANYPDEAKRQAFILMANSKAMHTYDQESENFKTSAQQVNEINYLPDVPLTVITRGKRVWPHNSYGDESERIWSELQNELSQLTSQSVHLVASQSGHLVHLDEPELVISAIEKTAESANRNEEIRIAKILQQKKLTDKNMLLVSINHLRSSSNKYVNPLYGIYTQTEDIYHASFLMPY